MWQCDHNQKHWKSTWDAVRLHVVFHFCESHKFNWIYCCIVGGLTEMWVIDFPNKTKMHVCGFFSYMCAKNYIFSHILNSSSSLSEPHTAHTVHIYRHIYWSEQVGKLYNRGEFKLQGGLLPLTHFTGLQALLPSLCSLTISPVCIIQRSTGVRFAHWSMGETSDWAWSSFPQLQRKRLWCILNIFW